jgi:hypothetical protein
MTTKTFPEITKTLETRLREAVTEFKKNGLPLSQARNFGSIDDLAEGAINLLRAKMAVHDVLEGIDLCSKCILAQVQEGG